MVHLQSIHQKLQSYPCAGVNLTPIAVYAVASKPCCSIAKKKSRSSLRENKLAIPGRFHKLNIWRLLYAHSASRPARISLDALLEGRKLVAIHCIGSKVGNNLHTWRMVFVINWGVSCWSLTSLYQLRCMGWSYPWRKNSMVEFWVK